VASVRAILKRLSGGSSPSDAARADAASPSRQIEPKGSVVPHAELVEGHSRHGCYQVHQGVERSFFFLCGHPRSGTHWMQSLLNLHPRINIQGEYHFEMLYGALWRFEKPEWHLGHYDPMREVARRGMQRLVRECMLTTVYLRPQADLVGDVTPREVFQMLPGAPTIHLIRDGRDVCTSWTFHQFRVDDELNRDPWKVRMFELRDRLKADPTYFDAHPEQLLSCESWVRHVARVWANRAKRDEFAKGRYARGELDGKVLEVRYESVHADPEAERRRMYEFLGVNPDEAAPIEADPLAKPGFGGQAQGPTSFYRSGKRGDWERYFTPEARQWFREEAGEMLVALGYEPRGGEWDTTPAAVPGGGQ
jgi:hypothetical protein